jgi:ribose 5-phosphate isomerase B
MNIAIGTDHRGFQHKEYIKLQMQSISWIDVGAYDEERSDYPLFAQRVCEAMQTQTADVGILICATGVGMAIAANRYPKIYAALAWNIEIALQSKTHDGANVLVLPSDYVSYEEAVDMIEVWLHAAFRGERYQQRLAMIDKLP